MKKYIRKYSWETEDFIKCPWELSGDDATQRDQKRDTAKRKHLEAKEISWEMTS